MEQKEVLERNQWVKYIPPPWDTQDKIQIGRILKRKEYYCSVEFPIEPPVLYYHLLIHPMNLQPIMPENMLGKICNIKQYGKHLDNKCRVLASYFAKISNEPMFVVRLLYSDLTDKPVEDLDVPIGYIEAGDVENMLCLKALELEPITEEEIEKAKNYYSRARAIEFD